jgi:hypothetical protein
MARLIMAKRETTAFRPGMIVHTQNDDEPWRPRRNYQPINILGPDKSVFVEWLDPLTTGPPEDPVEVEPRKWMVDIDKWGPNDENFVEDINNPEAERIQRLIDHTIDVT